VEPEAVAYAEAVRALDQQTGELDALRTRAGTLFAIGAVVSSFFAATVVQPGSALSLPGWIAVGLFCGVGLSALAILWPWKWQWVPPATALVRDYVDGENRVTAEVMQRDLAVHLGSNFAANRRWLDVLHVALMGGIICLAGEVTVWLVAL
jgi:hypothetical protein